LKVSKYTWVDHAKVFDVDQRDYFEERAAIREYDGRQERKEAEWKAYLDTCKTFRLKVVGEIGEQGRLTISEKEIGYAEKQVRRFVH